MAPTLIRAYRLAAIVLLTSFAILLVASFGKDTLNASRGVSNRANPVAMEGVRLDIVDIWPHTLRCDMR